MKDFDIQLPTQKKNTLMVVPTEKLLQESALEEMEKRAAKMEILQVRTPSKQSAAWWSNLAPEPVRTAPSSSTTTLFDPAEIAQYAKFAGRYSLRSSTLKASSSSSSSSSP